MCVCLENLRLFRLSDFPCVHLSKFLSFAEQGMQRETAQARLPLNPPETSFPK